MRKSRQLSRGRRKYVTCLYFANIFQNSGQGDQNTVGEEWGTSLFPRRVGKGKLQSCAQVRRALEQPAQIKRTPDPPH